MAILTTRAATPPASAERCPSCGSDRAYWGQPSEDIPPVHGCLTCFGTHRLEDAPASAERDAAGAGTYRALVSRLVAQVAEYGFPVEGDSRYAKAIDSWCEQFARAAEARE